MRNWPWVMIVKMARITRTAIIEPYNLRRSGILPPRILSTNRWYECRSNRAKVNLEWCRLRPRHLPDYQICWWCSNPLLGQIAGVRNAGRWEVGKSLAFCEGLFEGLDLSSVAQIVSCSVGQGDHTGQIQILYIICKNPSLCAQLAALLYVTALQYVLS